MAPFLRTALLFYVIATTLGLVLRVALVSPVKLTFSDALHAHSHTLYFGWAALTLWTFFFARLGPLDRHAKAVLWAIAAVSAATFLAFLHSGYGRPGVLVSSASLLVWAWAIALFWRRARGVRELDVAFLRVAVVYVGLAGASALGRVVILVKQVADPLPGKLAVFGFLHAFAAFFTFGLMGLLAKHCADAGAPLDARRLRLQLWLMAPLSALTFPLGVPGGQASWLGPPARVAAGLLAVPSALWVWNVWRSAGQLSAAARAVLRTLAAMWSLKASMELAGALGLAEAAAAARHPAVLYLHVTLLGVVTAALLFLVRQAHGLASMARVHLHQGGVVLMSVGLAVAGLSAVTAGLWLAAAGGAVVVGAGALTAVEAWLTEPPRVTAQGPPP